MGWKKRTAKEFVWFFCTSLGGLTLFLFLFDILDIDLDYVPLVVGVIVTLIFVYIVRLTLWVFKKNM
ncbi:MAG: hypothetical protein JRI86_07035 [Deltaproteobacteria bacterium]|jgi:hypothetical protein|nr:hypothetical protein [Deltaproteobacteria bacterium]